MLRNHLSRCEDPIKVNYRIRIAIYQSEACENIFRGNKTHNRERRAQK